MTRLRTLPIMGLISAQLLFTAPPIIWGSQSWQTASAASFGAPISGHQSYDPLSLPSSYNQLPFNNFQNYSPFSLNFTGLQIPAFDPFDLDNPAWKLEVLETLPLESNPELVESIKAQLVREGHSPLQLDLSDLVYAEGSKVPVSFKQLIQNEDRLQLFRVREAQKTIKNGAHASFKAEKALFEAKNGHSQPDADIKSVSPPPEELVTSFKETWKVSDSPDTFEFDIDNIEYQNGRWPSVYSGTIKTEGIKINFKKTMTYDFKGQPVTANVELGVKNGPKIQLSWNKDNPQHSSDGLKKMDNLFQALLKSPTGIRPKDSSLLTNDQSKQGFQLVVKPAEEETSIFTPIKKLAEWFFGLFTDHAGEMRHMKSELNQLAKNDPKSFLLKVGFQDPSAMSYKDLKKVYTADAASNNSRLTPANKTFNPISFVFRLPRNVLKAAGTVVKFVMKLPVIRHVWHAQRRITGFIGGYLWGDNFDKKLPVTYSKDGPAVLGIGGMFSDKVWAGDYKDMLMESFGVESAGIVQNDTYFLTDVLQSLAYEYLGSIDRPVSDAFDAMVKGINEKGEVYVVVHSQGSGIAAQALTLLTEEQRSKIHMVTLGAQTIIDKKESGLASSVNLWNKNDPIPVLANRLKFVTNLLLPWNWGRLSERNVLRSNETSGHGVINYKQGLNKWIQELRTSGTLAY